MSIDKSAIERLSKIKYLYRNAIEQSAFSFKQLIHDYEERQNLKHDYPQFFLSALDVMYKPNFNKPNPHSIRHSKKTSKYDTELLNYIDNLDAFYARSIKALNQLIILAIFGINHRSYIRFKALTPKVWIKYGKNDASHEIISRPFQKNPTQEEAQFCFDFVLETAMRLQKLELNLDKK